MAVGVVAECPVSFLMVLEASPAGELRCLLGFPPFSEVTEPVTARRRRGARVVMSISAMLLLPVLFGDDTGAATGVAVRVFMSKVPRAAPATVPIDTRYPETSRGCTVFLLAVVIPVDPGDNMVVDVTTGTVFVGPWSVRRIRSVVYLVLLCPYFFFSHEGGPFGFKAFMCFFCHSLPRSHLIRGRCVVHVSYRMVRVV